MTVINYVRYGTELEGPYRGLPTLVLLTARHHSLDLVERLVREHGKPVQHVWLECAQGERYDWAAVNRIANRHCATVVVRDGHDLPPDYTSAALLWDVPAAYVNVAGACDVMRCLKAPFKGVEATLKFRPLDTMRYVEDEIWQVR